MSEHAWAPSFVLVAATAAAPAHYVCEGYRCRHCDRLTKQAPAWVSPLQAAPLQRRKFPPCPGKPARKAAAR